MLGILFKTTFSVVAFEAEVSWDSFLPAHGRLESTILLSSKDHVELHLAPRDVRENCSLHVSFSWKRDLSVQEDLAELKGQQPPP